MRYFSAKNRSILREMVASDFKIRYQSSALGYLWSALRPLFQFVILYVVFTYILKLGKGVEHYSVYLLLGTVLWGFFVESTMIGMTSVVSKSDLIRKISIPKYLTVLSTSISAAINLAINLVIVFVFALINGVTPSISWLLIIPIAIELFAFSTAVSFFLSALYVKLRDITYVWEVGLQAAFYATPILYPLTLVDEQYRKWFFFNPMAQIIQDARYAVVTKQSITSWGTSAKIAIASPILVICAVLLSEVYFRSQSKWFAENA
jgi:ABC-2 type transport system permease protein